MHQNTKLNLKNSIRAVLYGAMVIGPMAVAADDSSALVLEEVLVTATKRTESLQDVPLAVSAVTEEMIRSLRIDDFSDLSRTVPGMVVTGANPSESDIVLRGISPLGGSGTPVAVYIDEMPVSGTSLNQPDLRAFDVERIEVLRGPQGTLYGEGSLGGTIRMVMNKPDTSEAYGRVDLTGSTTEDGGSSAKVQAMYNLPLIDDTLAVRAVLQYRDEGGFIDAPQLGESEVNAVELSGGRITLRWTPSESLIIDLSAKHQEVDGDGISVGGKDYNNSLLAIMEPYEDEYDQFNLTFDYDLGWASLISATSYYDREGSFTHDLSSFVIPIFQPLYDIGADALGVSGAWQLDAVGNVQEQQHEIFTQELRLTSTADGSLRWTAGLFYKDRENSLADTSFSTIHAEPGTEGLLEIMPSVIFGVNDFDLISDTSEEFEQIAIFGEVEYDLTEHLELTVGGRYFEETVDSVSLIDGGVYTLLGGISVPQTTEQEGDTSEFNPKLTLSYNTDNSTYYATASRGFRTGGINGFAPLVSSLIPGEVDLFYEPDTLWNYEFGWKMTLLDGRMTLNGAIYHMDWSDIQISSDPSGAGISVSQNAGDATSDGIELESVIQLSEGFQISFGGAYTDAQLTEDVPELDYEDGDRLPYVPKWSGHIALDYSVVLNDKLEGIAQANYSYVGENYSTVGESSEAKMDSYDITNISGGIQGETFSALLFVDNLFDETAELVNNENGTYVLNRPRTYGLRLTMDF